MYYVKDYPRPQLMRDNWTSLDGRWDFRFDFSSVGEKEKWYEGFEKEYDITVPFTYETELSGINRKEFCPSVWYSRTIDIDLSKLQDDRVLLHFEGSDFLTKVYVNGIYCGMHRGGYSRFSFDITEKLQEGRNLIVVNVLDSKDTDQPRGKQRWADFNHECWYVQTTGIWKSVWFETVPSSYITGLKLTPVLAEERVDIELDACTREDATYHAEFTVTFDGNLIASSRILVGSRHVKTSMNLVDEKEFRWAVHTWSPAHPDLYEIKIVLFKDNKAEDSVMSYFGMRDIRIEKGNILLNGNPVYQRLILDQGYWPESGLTPPSEDALKDDIEKCMAMGYNGARKHMKIEDERFLYWCDVKGFLLWSEMAATYRFSDSATEEFTREWMEIVRQNYNHPCIITWTPFNESWGIKNIKTREVEKDFTVAIYHLTKAFDPMRPVITNDGWEHTVSDIITLHDYEELGRVLGERYGEFKSGVLDCSVYHNLFRSSFASGYEYKGQPIIISEFGGIAFSSESGWGYGNMVKTEEEFIKRFDDITTAIKKLPYVAGYCYTQVSDVEQEINGLLTPDRKFKIKPEIINEINTREVSPVSSQRKR